MTSYISASTESDKKTAMQNMYSSNGAFTQGTNNQLHLKQYNKGEEFAKTLWSDTKMQ